MGVGTPRIFWISASISVNRFVIACSMESLIEERLDPAVDGGRADVVYGGWLIVRCGRAEWPIGVVTSGVVV